MHKATEKEEEENEAKKRSNFNSKTKTKIDKHCCRNGVWILGKCEWLVFLFHYSPLFFTRLCFALSFCCLYSHPMSVYPIHHTECTGILPFIIQTQTSKNVSLLLHGIKKKATKKLRSFLSLPLSLPLFQNPFLYKYKWVQSRFPFFCPIFVCVLLLLFWTLLSFVKRASMTATWMRVFLLILFRIKIQWTFIHTFWLSYVSVCLCVLLWNQIWIFFRLLNAHEWW